MAATSKPYRTYLRHYWHYHYITFSSGACLHTGTFMHTCTLQYTLVYWHITLCDGNHSVSTMSQYFELLGHKKKKEQNALKLYKAQCGFCCYSETRPSLSPTHICKIINRCLKSLLRPAYHKHSLCLIILFHFLSHRVWLCSFAFPQFHLHRSRADALTPQTHANAQREQHRASTNSHMLSTFIQV